LHHTVDDLFSTELIPAQFCASRLCDLQVSQIQRVVPAPVSDLQSSNARGSSPLRWVGAPKDSEIGLNAVPRGGNEVAPIDVHQDAGAKLWIAILGLQDRDDVANETWQM
jgi:hypothetical protein